MGDSSSRSLAIGFFDGLHLGHQAILRKADSVLTFVNHPLTVIAPAKAPKLLMPTAKRLAALKSLVQGEVKALEFTSELQALEATDFAARFLSKSVKLVCGENWRFGQGGKGDARLLRTLGYEVEVVAPEYCGEQMISSTRIRQALSAGDLSLASQMLGKNYAVYGETKKGKGEGRALGYPTINIDIGESPLKFGVYKVKVGSKIAIANFGIAPTFNERAWARPMLELHFLLTTPFASLDFVANATPIELLAFIRPEKKFVSLDELKAQIARDYATIVA